MADEDEIEDLDEDEEESEEEEGEEEEESGGGKKKLILIIAGAALLLLVGGGATLFLTGALDSLLGVGEEKEHDPNEVLAKPILIEMPEMLVDLKTGRCRAPFLKLLFQIAVATPADQKIIEEVQPHIQDRLKMHLRTLERQDLVGREGAEKLRFDIITIINRTARPVTVRHVLFKEFLLQ